VLKEIGHDPRYNLRQNTRYNGSYGLVHTTINGEHGKFRVRKRPKTSQCELCGDPIVTRWNWHHWDDTCLELGIWVCYRCHCFVGGIDAGLGPSHIDKYLALKESSRELLPIVSEGSPEVFRHGGLKQKKYPHKKR